ncbi:hypothetical protein, partial [Pseudomonas sp. FFUP_PS_473]|uniref:hypothetical protein n=1 Tax=Pseudomonas sp. FFUP_PS_473 TaxID=2060418 RepID=UPI0015B1E010
LFAPTLAERAILPTALGGSYFFNRIGLLLSFTIGSFWPTDAHREKQLWGNSIRRMSKSLLQTGNGKSPV